MIPIERALRYLEDRWAQTTHLCRFDELPVQEQLLMRPVIRNWITAIVEMDDD